MLGVRMPFFGQKSCIVSAVACTAFDNFSQKDSKIEAKISEVNFPAM